jgi:peptidoglycan/LPS O-acetylase OafA/YrhL
MVRLPVGRIVLRILIGALCVSAAVASLAILLRREISDTDGNVILTSLLFALASAMAAAGYAVADRAKALGAATVVAAAASFALFTLAVWTGVQDEAFWRPVGCLGIFALESAHAAFVLSRRRAGDSLAVANVARAAVALAVVSGALGMAPLAGLVDDVSDFYLQLLSVVLIGQLLCTALGPPLRRLAASAPRPVIEVPTERERLALELTGVAERLERLDASPQVLDECRRLRRLARSAAG